MMAQFSMSGLSFSTVQLLPWLAIGVQYQGGASPIGYHSHHCPIIGQNCVFRNTFDTARTQSNLELRRWQSMNTNTHFWCKLPGWGKLREHSQSCKLFLLCYKSVHVITVFFFLCYDETRECLLIWTNWHTQLKVGVLLIKCEHLLLGCSVDKLCCC